MRDGDEIDREAWARLLDSLLRAADMTPETAAAPAGPIPVGWRSIRRWLSQDSGVSARNVRDVCRALNYPTTRALVEVGFLLPAEVGVTGLAAPPTVSSDPLVRKIYAALNRATTPTPVRSVLRRMLTSAYEGWLDMNGLKAPADIVGRSSRPSRAK